MKRRIAGAVAVLIAALACAPPGARAQAYLNLTVDRAVSIALDNNRDIKDAVEEKFRAGLQITEAASAAYPSLNGFWDTEKVIKPMVFIIEFPDPVTGKVKKNRLQAGTDHTMNMGASLNQNLWLGGKVGTARKAAKIYQQVSIHTLSAVEQNVVAGIVQAFNGALLAREMLGISQKSLSQTNRHLENVQNLHDAGSATKYDLLRARVQVSNMTPAVLAAENRLTSALLRLRETMGIDPETALSIDGAFAEPDTTIFAVASAETALANRPDLKASEQSVDLYKSSIKIARGDMLPSLTAGTTFQYMGNFDTWQYDARTWNPYWTARVNLSFPIFSGLRNFSRYQQAKVDHRKAQTNYRKTRDAVVIGVEENVLVLRNAVRSIESQRMNIEEAEMAFEMAESLFAAGKATQLEVLDAQLALESSRTNMVSALYDGVIAETVLRRSLGIIDIPGRKGN
jgi:outer membrane protein